MFESNSSSSHSVTIDTNSTFTSITPKDGVIDLCGGEYGWEFVKYTDPLEKANYCAVAVNHPKYEDYRETLIEVIKEQTGATEVKIAEVALDDYSTYIDHQSLNDHDKSCRTIFSGDVKENLRNFIFRTNSVLHLGNDNSTAPPNFHDPIGKEYARSLKIDIVKERYLLTLEESQNEDKIKEAIDVLITRQFDYEWNIKDISIERLEEWDGKGEILLAQESYSHKEQKYIEKQQLKLRFNVVLYIDYEKY
mgnify:CR=1 FL=1